MTRRRWVTVALVVLLGAVFLVRASGGDGVVPVPTETVRVAGVREADKKPVNVEGTLYFPAGSGAHPAVLLAHGYGGSQLTVADQARDLARHGYVVLAYSARGFGFSGGKIHLDSPKYEVKDAESMIDLLGARKEVRQDAPGDPRVAVVGASYGGALALILARSDRRVDAVVPSITWNDLRQALFPQSQTVVRQASAAQVDPSGVTGVFKKQWAAIFFGSTLGAGAQEGEGSAGPSPSPTPSASPSPSAGGTLTPQQVSARKAAVELARKQAADQFSLQTLNTACGKLATDLCLGYLQTATSGRPTKELLDLLEASSPKSVPGVYTAPTLLIQGEADSLFPLSEADANAADLAADGARVSMVWTSGGHDGGTPETAREWKLTDDFLGRVLTGPSRFTGRIPGPGLQVTVPDALVSSVDTNPASQHRSSTVLPGLVGPGSSAGPALKIRSLPLNGGEQLAIAPPGATPAALTSLPGFGSALSLLSQAGQSGATGTTAGSSSLSLLPGQTASFETAPVRAPFTLTGTSRVRVHVTSTAKDAVLFASLLDVAPNGSTSLPEQLVAPVRLDDLTSAGRSVTIALPGVVHDVQAGHRLRVVLATTDQGFALPQDARGYRISLASPQLTVPTVALTADDEGSSNGPVLIWALFLLLALVLALVTAMLLSRRASRRDRLGTDDRLAGVPLMITGLGKAYADGFRAVSELSFEVAAGQVLGLLGPNGAGKTTTLRMLMGLINPTEGEIRIFGHRVRAGAPVLSRVGAFVEGPGFLPHLSGLDNLELYWRATGRPHADARFDIALEVAGLGDDVKRRVRTYSQGMRQRLAIAQAMLGLPELLVLDEPTNGLDPPQIREMREVLQRYAATGRTVVVSSHLLAEVEQTCSHVVVMTKGRLVAQGPVEELVGRAGTVVLDVDEPARAGELAAAVPGVDDVTVTAAGLRVHAPAAIRPDLVQALVAGGVRVASIAPQRGLEETFLSLVGGED